VFTTTHGGDFYNRLSPHSDYGAEDSRDIVDPMLTRPVRPTQGRSLLRPLRLPPRRRARRGAFPVETVPEECIREFMISNIKDLAERYDPHIVWSDADWISTSEQYHPQEFISLYIGPIGRDGPSA